MQQATWTTPPQCEVMASKRKIRRSMCGSKIKHETQEDAYVAGKIAVRKQKQVGAKVGAYRCRFCGKFHWGHKRYV